MKRRTKYTIAGAAAIVAVFAAVYWFFLRGTAAGNALSQLLHPGWTTPESRSAAQFPERSPKELASARARVGGGLSRSMSASRVTTY